MTHLVREAGWAERVEGVHALGRLSLLVDLMEASTRDSRDYATTMLRLSDRAWVERSLQPDADFEACYDRGAEVRTVESANLWFRAGRLHQAFRVGLFSSDLFSAPQLRSLVEMEVRANPWRGTSFENQPQAVFALVYPPGGECVRVSLVPGSRGLLSRTPRRWACLRRYREELEISKPAA